MNKPIQQVRQVRGRQGFSQVIILGFLAVIMVIGAGGFLTFREKKASSSEETGRREESLQKTEEKTQSSETRIIEDDASIQPIGNGVLPPCSSPTATNCQKQKMVPMVKNLSDVTERESLKSPSLAPNEKKVSSPTDSLRNTSGYTFEIIGYVYDATDAPAMTNGIPAVGVVVRTIGPKIVTTQARTNGSYTLSFANAPLGIYDVCITLPVGYTMNPVSGCERVIVRLSKTYDKTLELENNGNIALHGTGINFSIMRQQTQNVPSSTDEPPLKLKGIGVNFEDFVFTKAKLQFDRIFMGFGFVIPGSSSSSGQDKSNPQPTYVVPLGTPVRSIVDGIVVAIPTLWSGDVSIQVTADGKMQKWIYETEHLINPKVAVGDKVVAGQIIGEVGSFGGGDPPGYGAVEIGILKGGQAPEHVCPFAYLDDSIREATFAKMRNLFQSWEEYVGDQTLYTDTEIPGCLTLHPIEG